MWMFGVRRESFSKGTKIDKKYGNKKGEIGWGVIKREW